MTTTFSPPETVTIPGEIALEIVALLNAYAEVCAGFRLDGEPDPFFTLEEPVWRALVDALGFDREKDLDEHPWYQDADARSHMLADVIRSRFDGPALGAITTTKMAHDLAEVKARLEFVHV